MTLMLFSILEVSETVNLGVLVRLELGVTARQSLPCDERASVYLVLNHRRGVSNNEHNIYDLNSDLNIGLQDAIANLF